MPEFDLKLRFCPKCKERRDTISLLRFCAMCGTRLKEIALVVTMEGDKVERVLLKSQK